MLLYANGERSMDIAKRRVFKMRAGYSISGISGVSVLAMMAAAFAFLPALSAQAPGAGNRPNFTGVWDLEAAFGRSLGGPGADEAAAERRGGTPRQGFATEEPPMRPEAEARYRQARQGVTSIYSSGGDEFDPTHSCFPHGMPRIYTTPRPFEIVQVPHVLVQMFESDHWIRRIHTDGRQHPEGYPFTWMGHSVGTWNGNTLVVDTININPESWWLDNLAHPKSDALHITERFRSPNQDTLEIDFTFDDAKTYTRPWNGKKVFVRAPKGYEVLEDVTCEDLLDLNKKGRY
jgi:hypothetical protein